MAWAGDVELVDDDGGGAARARVRGGEERGEDDGVLAPGGERGGRRHVAEWGGTRVLG